VVGHLNVKENQIRPDVADSRKGLGARAAFADELDFTIAREQYAQAPSSQRFIVNDYRAYSCELLSQVTSL